MALARSHDDWSWITKEGFISGVCVLLSCKLTSFTWNEGLKLIVPMTVISNRECHVGHYMYRNTSDQNGLHWLKLLSTDSVMATTVLWHFWRVDPQTCTSASIKSRLPINIGNESCGKAGGNLGRPVETEDQAMYVGYETDLVDNHCMSHSRHCDLSLL